MRRPPRRGAPLVARRGAVFGAGSGSGGGPHLAPEPRSWPRLPGPWLSVLLVLVFVGFGALLGDSGAGAGRLPAGPPSLKVLVPHSSPRAASTGGGSAGSGTGGATEPPSSQAEETPSAEGAESAAPTSPGRESPGATETGQSAPNARKRTGKPAPAQGQG